MIMPRSQDPAIYSRTFSALLAEARHGHPPVAPCHLFTSVNTSPIGIPIPRRSPELAEAETTCVIKLLEITNNWGLNVLTFFVDKVCKVYSFKSIVLVHDENNVLIFYTYVYNIINLKNFELYEIYILSLIFDKLPYILEL